MTHPIIDFKYWPTFVCVALPLLCIGLACSIPETSVTNEHPTNQTAQIQQNLKHLQQHALALQQYALEMESQIDEVRRATANNQTEEITVLRTQLTELQKEHTMLQRKMDTLRETLNVYPTTSSTTTSP